MNTNPIIQSMMIFEQSPEVIDFKGKAITTSLAVSAFFGKRHKNVLQAIENLDCSPEFSGLNFQPSKYKDEHYHDKKAQLERSALYHWQTQK